MKKKQNVPVLRFQGFSGEWAVYRLGDLGNLRNGMNFAKEAMGKGYPFVNLQNIFGKNIIEEENLGKAMASASQLSDYDLKAGDVLFVRSSVKLEGVGESAVVCKDLHNTTYSGFIIRFRDEVGIDNNFKRFIFSTKNVRKQIISQATNSANKNISQPALSLLNLSLPDKKEQKSVGAFFANLDGMIASSQDKIQKLQQFRQAMLAKLFPREGAEEPELRFRGFSGKWKCKILRELADFYSGGTPTVGIKEYYSGNIPFIRSAEIHSAKTALYISDEGLNCSSARMVKKGDILYALYGATSGEVGRAKLTGAINQAILAILPNKNCDADFLTQWLHKSKINILSTYLQGGQGNLSGEIIKNLRILLPTLEEQRKIGNFFRRLDDLISVQQKKLERMQRLKSALLEKMFV